MPCVTCLCSLLTTSPCWLGSSAPPRVACLSLRCSPKPFCPHSRRSGPSRAGVTIRRAAWSVPAALTLSLSSCRSLPTSRARPDLQTPPTIHMRPCGTTRWCVPVHASCACNHSLARIQESSSQRVMYSLVEQDTGNSKKRFFILSDATNTPLMHLKRVHLSSTGWEGYDCWTHELLFRIAPALVDPNNLMLVSFRNSAAIPATGATESKAGEAARPSWGEDSDPPTLPRLADFEADWPVPSQRHPGEYDRGDLLPCLLSNWRALHTRERVHLFTRQCSRSDCLAEVVREWGNPWEDEQDSKVTDMDSGSRSCTPF